ncbi:MAG: Gfo/Idh/MocA family protein [Sphaerochaetaceae bacterium]
MRIGIIGAGKIAKKMALTINSMEDSSLYAIASRSLEKAEEFAKEFQIEKAYGSYEDMVSDDKVDLVYVATPHSHHYEHCKLALEHNKNILCEKAFTVNETQAKEILDLARKKHLLAAEAIWTRYLPMRKMLDDILSSGIIGEPQSLTANLGYAISDVPRLHDPGLAGGALLDLGVYTINFALMAFGSEISGIDSSAVMLDTGVDAQNSIAFSYNDGRMAVLLSTQMANTDRRGSIFGTKGFVEVENINNPESIRIYDSEYKLIKELIQPPQITGFEYEVRSCINAIKSNSIECPEMPHEEILRVMRIMDAVRTKWS